MKAENCISYKQGKKFCALLFALLLTEGVLANPMGGNVTAGSAVISQTTGTTNINQSSQKAIINWQSFNINRGEGTHFYQPAGGITLNRISATQGASQIYGTLTATGRIILVNPAGIYFGPSAYVNVGGIIASTANITDVDFLNGNYRFTQDPLFNGSVINNGTIIAANHGLVALIGSNVENNGMIQANLGSAVLGSGNDFALSFAGNDLISIGVNSGSMGGVRNTGSIIANGGRVMVSAKTAANVLDNLVNISGHIEANSVNQTSDGRIFLTGGSNGGTVRVAANMKAKEVKVTGYNVVLDFPSIEADVIETSGNRIKVNGATMKGYWLIDPNDITIGTLGDITPAVLANNLMTADIKIQTTFAGIGGNGDIFVNDDISWNSYHSLMLSAYRNITSNANISNAGSGNLILQADNTGTGTGTVSFTSNKNATLNGGNVKVYYNPTVFGTQDAIYTSGTTPTKYMLVNNATHLQNVNLNLSDNYALGRDIDASSLVASLGNSITPYSGLFDGQGYRVKNLNISLFGVNSGSISHMGVSGNISGTNNVGGLVGVNTGSIQNSYSLASVIGTNFVGGLVGTNQGMINASFAGGFVSGLTSGGLVGNNTGTVTNSYWNTETTGQPGGLTSTQMMSPSSFAGFDFGNIWGIIPNKSYPYLKAAFTGTPRAITGFLNPTDPLSHIAYNNVNQEIGLINNGNIIDYSRTGNNGFYYFLEANNVLPDASPLLTFISNGSSKGNSVTVAPSSGGSIKDLFIDPNTVTIVPNGEQAFAYKLVWPQLPIKNLTFLSSTTLANAIGDINNVDLLYTASLFNMTVPQSASSPTNISGWNIDVKNGYNFATAPKTFLELNGDLSTTNGSITFGGYDDSSLNIITGATPIPLLAAVQIGSNGKIGQPIHITTNTSGNITNNAFIVWPYGPTPGTIYSVPPTGVDVIPSLHLTAANNIRINAPIIGFSRLINVLFPGASLNLSAAYTDKSITTGPSGMIHVARFNLLQGKWYQSSPYISGVGNVGDSLGIVTVPPYTFFAASFRINNSNIPSSVAEFIRVQGGDGTNTSPYLIADAYGLQGIGSNSYTLSSSWKVNQNITGYIGLWNAGQGFVPIGNSSLGFSGHFDGNMGAGYYIESSTFGFIMNWPSRSDVGLFGTTTPTALIENVALAPSLIRGNNNVGSLVGHNQGTVRNAYVFSGSSPLFVIGNNNVGGIIGLSSGLIQNSHIEGTAVRGTTNVGGLVGQNTGIIDRTLAANYITGTTSLGGISGVNSGTILNSFWDTDYTGLSNAVGTNIGTLLNILGGCFGGQCTNGGTVNLSSAIPYLAAGWDFSNTGAWGILPNNQSYPYHKAFFSPSWSHIPVVFSGKTSVPLGGLQVFSLYVSANASYNPNTVILSPNYIPLLNQPNAPSDFVTGFITNPVRISMATVTGANGFFYQISKPTHTINNAITTVVTGGGATGSITFLPQINKSVSKIVFPITTTGTLVNPITSVAALTANLTGVTITSFDDYVNLVTNSTNPKGTYSQARDRLITLLESNSAYLDYLVSNKLYFYQDDLLNQYNEDYNNTGVIIVDTSIKGMQKTLDNITNQLLNRYGVRQLPNYCD